MLPGRRRSHGHTDLEEQYRLRAYIVDGKSKFSTLKPTSSIYMNEQHMYFGKCQPPCFLHPTVILH
jgi:hypothetical protein